ncbi:type 4a pilus biogenesis protein PilO [Vibrio sp. ABG19]|uniref:type 4a pilus biogenesis protein PilO n=1 Tax=Vibrio sp. ABG19 TaxID=2817385 RepID=UPI00249F710F|nr:type 4a pilus biogenesis protein PilO [Vibrio sp. ABG19]WGY48057.1 type 4a pilus biogenesis protein PilO [Vibrio sp. ABG19]
MMRDLQFDLSEMAQWSPGAQWLLRLLLVLIVAAIGYQSRLLPQQQFAASLDQQIEQISLELRQRAEAKHELQMLQDQYADQRASHDALLRHFPRQQQLAPLLNHISQLAAQHQLVLTRLEWQTVVPEAQLLRVPLRLEASGEYPALRHFMRDLAALPFGVLLTEVRWQRISPELSRLQIRARGFTYLADELHSDDEFGSEDD